MSNPTVLTVRSPGKRHPWLERFCERLAAVSTADASHIADRDLREDALVVLPMWLYLVPETNVGSKANNGLIPSRIVWRHEDEDWSEDLRILQVSPDDGEVILRWQAPGLGWKEPACGKLALRCGPLREVVYDTQTGVPSDVTAEPVCDVRTWASEAAHDGDHAAWELFEMLQVPARQATERACHNISWEIAGFRDGLDGSVSLDRPVRPVIDAVSLEAAATELGLGKDGAESSPVWRLLRRCLLPNSFVRVEPLHFVQVSLLRDATAIVRRMIGDPHIGPKVRRVMREVKPDTTEELLVAYHKRYPGDRLSMRRAMKALTAGPDAMTFHLVTDHTGNTLIQKRSEL